MIIKKKKGQALVIIIKATNSFEGMILPVFSQKALLGGGAEEGEQV